MFVSKKSLSKLENIQNRALRFVLDDYQSGFTALLQNANVPGITIMVLLKTSSVSTKLALFTSIPCPCTMNVHPLRDSSILTVPKMNLNQYGLKSFNSYGVKMWNPLPISYEADISLDELKYWSNHGKVRKLNVSFTHAQIYHFTWISVRMCIYKWTYICVYVCVHV